jgi:DNA polymerase-1
MIKPAQSQLVLRDLDQVVSVYRGCNRIGIDIETTGLHPQRDQVEVISLSGDGVPPAVLHLRELGLAGATLPQELKDILSQATLVGHNITNFDLPFLRRIGIIPQHPWYDTLLLEQLANTGRRSVGNDLTSVLKRRLGVTIDKSLAQQMSWRTGRLMDEQVAYAANDVGWLLPLASNLLGIIRDHHLDDSLQLELDCQLATYHMRCNGVPIKLSKLAATYQELRRERAEAEAVLRDYGIRNPASTVQVRHALNQLGLHPPTTNHEVLESLRGSVPDGTDQARVLDAILRYRSVTRLMMYDEDWVHKYVIDGRIYPSYSQLGTEPGRFASREPNIQQWPKVLRAIVGAEPGKLLVWADYKQIEVVTACTWYGDQVLRDLLTKGVDVHRRVASLVWGIDEEQVTPDQRAEAKIVVWTFLFAGKLPDDVKAQLCTLFPSVLAKQGSVERLVRRHQNTGRPIIVRPRLGPRREISTTDLSVSRVVNTLVQGTAATGLKRALARLAKEGLGRYLVTCVHDEIVLECPEEEAEMLGEQLVSIMREEMEDHLGMPVEVSLGIGKEWA